MVLLDFHPLKAMGTFLSQSQGRCWRYAWSFAYQVIANFVTAAVKARLS